MVGSQKNENEVKRMAPLYRSSFSGGKKVDVD